MEVNFVMSHALTPCQKRITQRQVAAERGNLEELLMEGLNSGVGKLMTPARKRRIYQQALVGVLSVARR